MNNKWELFNQIVSQHKMDKEENVQRIFEQLFAELFGYSRLFGEIDAHRVLHIGSTDRVIPDIIIRDSLSNKDLFIVELKQLNLHYDKKYEEQLISYMRLLSLNVGILICDSIYVYVLDNNKPIFSKIDIHSENKSGDYFVELFSKGAFSADKIKDFIFKLQHFDSNVQKVQNELRELDIKEVVKRHFLKEFESAEIDVALKDVDFVIRTVPNMVVISTDDTEPEVETDIDTALNKEKIQDWVKRIFQYLLSNKLLTKEEICRLHDIEYSKKTFGVGHAMLVDTQKETIISGHGRYWQTPIGGYYICSQWWKANEQEYDINIRRWLGKVLPDYIHNGLGRR